MHFGIAFASAILEAERRWKTIGWAEGVRVILAVAHTVSEERRKGAVMVISRTTLLVIVLTAALSAGSRREVWHVDLTSAMRDGDARLISRYPISALRFSPDGRYIAVVAGEYDGGGEGKFSRMFILDATHPEARPKSFEISWGTNDSEFGGRKGGFQWAPTGEMIISDGLIDVANGQVCSIPNSSFFVSRDRIIRFAAPFTLFDTNCQEVGQAMFDREAYVLDSSPESRLVLVTVPRPHAYPEVDCFVADPITSEVIHRWTADDVDGGCPYHRFADRGTALCSEHGLHETGTIPVTCIDARTGARIGKPAPINGGVPIATSSGSSRIVGSDLSRVLWFTDEMGVRLRARVVWDFRTGKEIVRWSPRAQKYETDRDKGAKSEEDVFHFDISPDGNYVVEGGNGSVFLYRIEP